MKEGLQKEYHASDSKLTTDFNYKLKIAWPIVILEIICLGNILPVDSMLVHLLTYGEGWHNYHHSFASDYRSSELGTNFPAKAIEFFALLGLAYDLRTASEDAIKRKMLKSGDGSRTTLYSE
ncbi:Desaturase 1 [Carabus blaptoides fortunei]